VIAPCRIQAVDGLDDGAQVGRLMSGHVNVADLYDREACSACGNERIGTSTCTTTPCAGRSRSRARVIGRRRVDTIAEETGARTCQPGIAGQSRSDAPGPARSPQQRQHEHR